MGIDPTRGFPLTPDGRVADRLGDYERRLAALERGGPDLSPVDALPATPRLGQLVSYQNAAMAAQGIEWLLRYSGAASNPWKCVGGGLYANSGTGVTGFAPSGFTTSPWSVSSRLVLPLSGSYEVHARLNAYLTAGASQEFLLRIGYGTGGGQTVDWTSGQATANNAPVNMSGSGTIGGLSSGQTLQLYGTSGGGTWNLRLEQIAIRPLQVS